MSGDYWAYNRTFPPNKANYLVNPVMKDDSYYVIKLNVKASDTTSDGYPAEFIMSDAPPSPGGRLISISKTKCDFIESSTTITGGPIANASGIYVSVNDPGKRNSRGKTFFNLTPGTWYLNIHNVPGGCGKVWDGSPGVCNPVVGWGMK